MKRILLAVCALALIALYLLDSASVSDNRSFERTAIIVADNDGEIVSLFETVLSNVDRDVAEQETRADHVRVVHEDDSDYAALREKIYKDTPYTTFIVKVSGPGIYRFDFDDRWVPLGCVVAERFPFAGMDRCRLLMGREQQKLLDGYYYVRNYPPKE